MPFRYAHPAACLPSMCSGRCCLAPLVSVALSNIYLLSAYYVPRTGRNCFSTLSPLLHKYLLSAHYVSGTTGGIQVRRGPAAIDSHRQWYAVPGAGKAPCRERAKDNTRAPTEETALSNDTAAETWRGSSERARHDLDQVRECGESAMGSGWRGLVGQA